MLRVDPQPPSPSLVTPGTPSSNLLEGQRGEEGQLVVGSGGAGRGAAPYEQTEVCSQTWKSGKLCAWGVFLLTQKPHSLRQVYLRGHRHHVEKDPEAGSRLMTKRPTVRRGTSQSAGRARSQASAACSGPLSLQSVRNDSYSAHPPAGRGHQHLLTCS